MTPSLASVVAVDRNGCLYISVPIEGMTPSVASVVAVARNGCLYISVPIVPTISDEVRETYVAVCDDDETGSISILISATTSDEVREAFLVVPNDEGTESISVSNDVSGISSAPATVSENEVRGSVVRGRESDIRRRTGSGRSQWFDLPELMLCFASAAVFCGSVFPS